MMKTKFGTTIVILVCLSTFDAMARFPPASEEAKPPVDPRERRALREKAVRYVGDESRPLVESKVGDEAAMALLRCSRNCAKRLVALHAAGKLDPLPRVREVLLLIAQPTAGDEVCSYVIKHADVLANRNACDAFLAKPLELALGLQELSEAACSTPSEPVVSVAPTRVSKGVYFENETLDTAVGVSSLSLFALLLWRARNRRSQNFPA